MLIRILFLLQLSLLLSVSTLTAQKSFDLEDIFRKGTFRTKSLPGFNFLKDGKSYAIQSENEIKIHSIVDGKQTDTWVSSSQIKELTGKDIYINEYNFSQDETKILFSTDPTAIYRHSSKEIFYVYDKNTNSGQLIHDGQKISNATFSPDGNKVAYTLDNDLYYTDLTTRQYVRVTSDGKWNHIINGMSDWVYEEEFSFTRAFQWSEDSRKIAFLRFDESGVREFTMEYFRDSLYPEPYSFKYPKVGEDNSTVTVHIFNTETGRTVAIDQPVDKEVYYPRLKWTQDSNQLCVYKMNRHQNHLDLLLADAQTGETRVMFTEKNKYFIEINNYLTFLKDGKHFVWVSDGEGYNHAYLYNMNGEKVNRITTGDYDLLTVYGVDEKEEQLYYQVAAPTPIERSVYRIGLNGKKQQQLSKKAGNNSGMFSSNFDYNVMIHSDINTPPSYIVYDKKMKEVRIIEDNASAVQKMSAYKTGETAFFDFTTSEGVQLNGYWIKPSHFDPAKKYPVFMYLYGGPGSQQVVNRWGGGQSWWFKMIAEQGYIIACVDNRGTGGRGEEFRKMTYLQLGHYETIDQIEAAKYLGSLPFVDKDRIGIFGWSYGGYMSSLCLLKGNNVFKAALAVAPVTNWKWYDSIYTERYMRTEAENPDGYRQNSPVYFAHMLKGNYFLAHGMADDNVHFQNSVEMNRALIKAGKQFEFHMYPNSNHGIYHEGATMQLYQAMTNFIYNKL